MFIALADEHGDHACAGAATALTPADQPPSSRPSENGAINTAFASTASTRLHLPEWYEARGFKFLPMGMRLSGKKKPTSAPNRARS